jgi:hypothetical protein
LDEIIGQSCGEVRIRLPVQPRWSFPDASVFLRGQYRFRTGQTARNGDSNQGFANAYAAFLLDLPNDYGRDLLSAFPEYVQFPLFTYIQDKWQVSQKLTLDIGVRHELYPPATPKQPGGFSNYDISTNSLIIAGVGNNPSDMGRKTYLTNFAPRFGISYRLNEKTVIRTGYGLSYIPYPDNRYAYNFPVRQNNAFQCGELVRRSGAHG